MVALTTLILLVGKQWLRALRFHLWQRGSQPREKKIIIIFLYLITFWHPPNSIQALFTVGKYATDRNTTESNFVWSHSSVFSSHQQASTSQLFLTTSLSKWFSMIMCGTAFSSYLLNHMTLFVFLPQPISTHSKLWQPVLPLSFTDHQSWNRHCLRKRQCCFF